MILVVLMTQMVVFSFRGPLCSEAVLNSAKSGSARHPSFSATHDVFQIIMRHFDVGIWSSVLPQRLMEVVDILLPIDIRKRLAFICGSFRTRRPYDFLYFQNFFENPSLDRATGEFFQPTCVGVVDLDPFLNPRTAKVFYLEHASRRIAVVTGITKDFTEFP